MLVPWLRSIHHSVDRLNYINLLNLYTVEFSSCMPRAQNPLSICQLQDGNRAEHSDANQDTENEGPRKTVR